MATERVQCDFCHVSAVIQDDESYCENCGRRLRDTGSGEIRRPTGGHTTESTARLVDFVAAAPAREASPERTASNQGKSRPRAVLEIARGLEGSRRTRVREDTSVIGRTEGFPRELNFPDDGLLSPAHASFAYVGDRLMVTDCGSLNGVYLMVVGQAPLEDGQQLIMGSHVFRFELVPDAGPSRSLPDATGTQRQAAGTRRPMARLVVLNSDGDDGLAYPLSGEKTLIGRKNGAFTFPDDKLLSGRHAQFERIDGQFQVENLSLVNGTFVQVKEAVLEAGDVLRIGSQIIRVDYD